VEGPPVDALVAVDFATVDRDLVTAHMWFTLAAGQGTAAAQTNRGKIEAWLSAEEIAEAQRLAQEWTDRHPQLGSPEPETIRTLRR
jgi:hypothetical protein